MKKFKVFLNGYITYIVDEEDRAIALAEDDLRYIHPKFNIDVSGVREEEQVEKRRFRKEKHEWTYEVNWNHSLPVYGERKK